MITRSQCRIELSLGEILEKIEMFLTI